MPKSKDLNKSKEASKKSQATLTDLDSANTTISHSEKNRDEIEMLQMRLDEITRENRKIKNEMQQFEKVKHEFISICAHDLKSPISSMISFTEIIRTDWRRMSPEDREDIMDRIDKAGHHSLDLISDLLSMVSIESGKMKSNPEPLLLSEICHETLSHSDGNLKAKEIETEFIRKGSELKVSMDRQKGIQMLTNIVSNAIKFTPRGGKILLILSQQEKKIQLEIRDNGQGIPPEELPKIFERFQKTSTSATEGEKGSGLGLNIVKQLVEMFKGEIEVQSEVGKGTSFILSFPISESPMLLKLFSGKK